MSSFEITKFAMFVKVAVHLSPDYVSKSSCWVNVVVQNSVVTPKYYF